MDGQEQVAATTAASPAHSKGFAVLLLLAAGLAIVILANGYPLNLWLFGCLIPWIIVQDQRSKDKPWAAPVRALLNPALIALAILTAFLAFLKLPSAHDANVFVNWEDRLILNLHAWLRYPTKWQYAGLLVLATLVSWRLPRLKAVNHLSAAKKGLGAVASIVAVMANVSFLGQLRIVDHRYCKLESRIQAEYRKDDAKRVRHIDRALATEAIAQNLQSATPDTRAWLRANFTALADLNLPSDYRDAISRALAEKVSPGTASELLFVLRIDGHSWSDSAELRTTKPDQINAGIEQARQDAQDASRAESDAESGLRAIVTSIVGAGNGNAAAAAMSFFDPLVRALGLEMLTPITDAIHGQASDGLKDWLKDREKPLVDRAVDLARKSLHWDSLPRASAPAVALSLRDEALQIAKENKARAADEVSKVLADAVSENYTPDQLEQRIQDAKDEGIEADQVLRQFGAVAAGPGASSADGGARPSPEMAAWEVNLKAAQDAVNTLRIRIRAQDKTPETAEHSLPEPR
ncbi:MAG TPA: hypothetical protein VME18_00070 [Acidobacteriaceae bacterium]|nr:hypothetical protein [Acidobacteriaceae bacterium]